MTYVFCSVITCEEFCGAGSIRTQVMTMRLRSVSECCRSCTLQGNQRSDVDLFSQITRADLEAAQQTVGEFGGDNRAGVEGTLHRISGIRNRKGVIVGLTCRVGRAVTGHVDMIRDVLGSQQSLLFLGR